MTVTIKEILQKYPTEFNLDDIPKPILNHKVGGLNIEDVPKPTHTKANDHDKYTYKVPEPDKKRTQTIVIDNYLGQFTVDFPYDPDGELRGGGYLDETGTIHPYS